MPQESRDFASLLDELIAADRAVAGGRQPIPTVDYLAVAEALDGITVTADAAAAEYRETSAIDADLEALFEAAGAPTEAMLSIDPAEISRELGLSVQRQAAELARIRRAFAFRNHPDRVAPHLRERAMQRMKLANMLIDEARSRAE